MVLILLHTKLNKTFKSGSSPQKYQPRFRNS